MPSAGKLWGFSVMMACQVGFAIIIVRRPVLACLAPRDVPMGLVSLACVVAIVVDGLVGSAVSGYLSI